MIPIPIPRLGWSMEQGVFQGWIVPPGSAVRAGDALFRLEGDKAVQDVEATDAGTLHVPADAPTEGAEVIVGQVIGFLLAAGETGPASCGPPPARPEPATAPPPTTSRMATPRPAPSAAAMAPQAAVPAQRDATIETHSGERPLASPSVRRLARELGVDLARIKPRGQVTADDVYAYVARLISAAGGVLAASAAHVSAATHEPMAGTIPRRRRGLPKISPRAARLALEASVDWTRLSGSGAGGRIRESDIHAALARRGT